MITASLAKLEHTIVKVEFLRACHFVKREHTALRKASYTWNTALCARQASLAQRLDGTAHATIAWLEPLILIQDKQYAHSVQKEHIAQA